MAERKQDDNQSQAREARETTVLREARMSAEEASRISADASADIPQHDLGDATEHSRGGISTRHDATDMGVPMRPGQPNEPVGPEDALGPGPKRGDYRGRIGPSDYQPHQVVAVEDPKPGEVPVRVLAQRRYAEAIGDVPGRKGGVQTTEEDRAQ